MWTMSFLYAMKCAETCLGINFPPISCVLQVVDMPLLFETRSDKFMQLSICVHCNEEAQVRYLYT